ncbi:MAG: hypothetical protein WC755_07070 [Candidatus Woesearchaeota archaeon]|jgi:5-methylcytosine-specific restriction endonuclease McrA
MGLTILDVERIKVVAKLTDKNDSGNLKEYIRKARNILKVLERDNFKCVECGSGVSLTMDHHETPKHRNASSYIPKKCRTLCETCHIKKNKMEKNNGGHNNVKIL